MKRNAFEVAAGAMVLLLAGIFLVTILRNVGGNDQSNRYNLNAAFSSVEGVQSGDEVRMAGIPIGNVGEMSLDRENFVALVEVHIQQNVQIPDDSEINIASDGLLGGSYIEIVPGANLENLKPGDHFTYANGAVNILNLLAKFSTGASSE